MYGTSRTDHDPETFTTLAYKHAKQLRKWMTETFELV